MNPFYYRFVPMPLIIQANAYDQYSILEYYEMDMESFWTKPFSIDSDDDYYSDNFEKTTQLFSVSPSNPDSDGDGLTELQERQGVLERHVRQNPQDPIPIVVTSPESQDLCVVVDIIGAGNGDPFAGQNVYDIMNKAREAFLKIQITMWKGSQHRVPFSALTNFPVIWLFSNLLVDGECIFITGFFDSAPFSFY